MNIMKAIQLHYGAIISIIVSVCCKYSLSFDSTAQSRLTMELLNKYGPRTIRPVKNISQPINVSLRLLPSLLVRFDEVEQLVQLLASVRMIWTDENMMWDPNEFDGVDYVTVSRDNIWMPDIELHENIDKDFISYADTYIVANHKGRMDWYFPALLTSTCAIDITYFPFDTQHCKLSFTSWALDISLVQLKRSEDQDATYDKFRRNGVWVLTQTVTEDVTAEYYGKTWSVVCITLHLRREPGFYVNNIIIPSCMLTLLMTLVCWLHPASGEKVTLAVNNLVALILFQQLVADRIPPSGNSSSIIVNFFMMLIVLSCIEVACAIIVLRLYHTGNRKQIPTWMRTMITSRLLTPVVSDHARHLFRSTCSRGTIIGKHRADHTEDVKHVTCQGLTSSQAEKRHVSFINMARQGNNRKFTEDVPMQLVNGQLAEDVAPLLPDPEVNKVLWQEAAIICDRVLFVIILTLTFATLSYVLVSFLCRKDLKS